MKHVIVLSGGDSPEREVSLRSGEAVVDALQATDHQVTFVDPGADVRAHEAEIRQADVVFSVLHGTGGEDGTVQAILDDWKVPYVGSGTASSRLCFDKWAYKRFLNSRGLLLPAGELVDITQFAHSPLRKKPFVLKPTDGGSSLDTYIVHEPVDFDISAGFNHHTKMLLEELIDGTEITVGVLGETPLPVIEIIPPDGGDFDFYNKYNGKTQELCPPRSVSPELQAAAQALAVQAHQACDCRHLSRSDFIIDTSGQLYLLETNTLPGMTTQSLFPKMAAAAGIPMQDLCTRLVDMAKE